LNEVHSYYDIEKYWEERAKKYGASFGGWKAVLTEGEWEYKNRYVDLLHRKAVFSTVSEWQGKNVLDVGCGVGRFSLEFAKKGAHVTGIDISEEMIRIAKANFKRERVGGNFYVMSLDQMGFPDNSFDIVSSILVLQHLTNPKVFMQAIRHIVRITKPYGKILLLEYAPRMKRNFPANFYLSGLSRNEYVARFESLGTTLIKEKGVQIMRLDEFYTKIAYALKKDISPTTDRSKSEVRTAVSSSKRRILYYACRKIPIQLDMFFNLHLSSLPLIRNRFSTKLFLFEKKSN